MRHLYECPMRWADLDMLGHVNNVTYVDYLREARSDFLWTTLSRDSSDAGSVLRHEVAYLFPLLFRFRPVHVECWVSAVEADTLDMAFEVFHDVDGARTVYLRATTRVEISLSAADRATLATYVHDVDPPEVASTAPVSVGPGAFTFPLHVRHSDLDASGVVDDVQFFEFLQESRVRMIADLTRGRDLPPMHFVVAQTDVDYLAPIRRRAQPYRVVSEVSRVGRRSMAIDSEIFDADRRLASARVTTVFFDLEKQTSVDPHPALRERLLQVAR